MESNPARTILMILMNIVMACAIAVTLRLGVEFFGQLAAQSWGKAAIVFTGPLVIPFGVDAIKTPYGGIFDVNAAGTVVLLLFLDWVLSGIRHRA